MSIERDPRVSIIIPVHNGQDRITHALEGALAAASAYRNSGGSSGEGGRFVEVIVVDDGSIDETKAQVQKFPTVKYIYQDNAGPAAARNRGAGEARGDILFFTDADCLPHQDWIELILPHFEKPDVAVVAGSYGIANPERRLARCIHREIIYRHMMLMSDFPSYFGSFNFAVRAEVFRAVGGFDTRYRNASGEDNDLSYKIAAKGYRIFFAKDALVDHYHPEELKSYLEQQRRHGYWRVRMYRDHPRMAKGDGYTFWKDLLEIALVFGIYFSFALIFLGFFIFAVWSLFVLFVTLLAVNIYFGMRVMGEVKDGLYFADVMILRAFKRANGFIAGCEIFLPGHKSGIRK